MIQKLYEYLVHSGVEVYQDEPLSGHITFKLGGKADLFACPSSEEELVLILKKAKELSVPHYILGKGSNLLVPDDGYRGIVINIGEKMGEISLVGDDTIVCGAGALLTKVCLFALEHSLSGIEFAYGIPGSAGGAAFMNAGAYGGEMKDVLVKCTHLDSDFNKSEFSSDSLNLGYRSSAYSGGGYVILSLTIKLKKGEKSEIKAKMDDLMARRKSKQPLEYPSAGSTFKRPEGYFAGKLIQDAGLKGYSVGGAMVSEKHSGFVINYNNATCADVLNLCSFVRDTVEEKFGVKLEREIKILG